MPCVSFITVGLNVSCRLSYFTHLCSIVFYCALLCFYHRILHIAVLIYPAPQRQECLINLLKVTYLLNDHDGVSHGVECSQEGDRIPPLKSNRQALEQEHRLSWVLRDCSDASTNFLNQLYGRLVPGTGINNNDNNNSYYYYYHCITVQFYLHWQTDNRQQPNLLTR